MIVQCMMVVIRKCVAVIKSNAQNILLYPLHRRDDLKSYLQHHRVASAFGRRTERSVSVALAFGGTSLSL